MKIPAEHEKKSCLKCLGVLCKKCNNVSHTCPKICIDCEAAPLRNNKTHVIYNILRLEGACASVNVLRDAYKLLKTAKKSDLRKYDVNCFSIEKIQLQKIFGDDLAKLETDLT